MMTRQHFQFIADVLKEAIEDATFSEDRAAVERWPTVSRTIFTVRMPDLIGHVS